VAGRTVELDVQGKKARATGQGVERPRSRTPWTSKEHGLTKPDADQPLVIIRFRKD
jgi:hypothetical protein